MTSDLSFSQVTEVDKREPRESFLKPRPQAEAEKCSRGSLLSTEVTRGNSKIKVETFLSQSKLEN